MAAGSMTLACLLLAANAGAPPDFTPLNANRFSIPLKIEPARRPEIRELRLFVSADQGRTWERVGQATPDKEGFAYTARADGMYWFSVAIVDQKGQQEPADVSRAPVGQKILVDTTKPDVHITAASRQGDELTVRCDLREEYPDPATLKLEYRPSDGPKDVWTPLPLMFGQNTVSFKPGTTGSLVLRLTLRDLAGNEGVDLVEVQGTAPPVSPQQVVPVGAGPAPVGPPPPAPGGQVGSWAPAEQSGGVRTPPDGTAGPLPGGNAGGQVLAMSAVNEGGKAPAPAPTPGPAGRGNLPALQIVNKRQVKLEFEVAKFGPSGLGGVDVYVTTDEGATWKKSPSDPATTLPLSPEAHPPTPVRGSVTVQLADDGVIYGFYLVVKSRAGLGKPPPRPGDQPQVRVEVDTTPPVAELYTPQPDPGRRDTLILSWVATDKNLATNPVSLEWAERREGPWNFIGPAELPNTGRYSWQVPANVPPSVFLRLTVGDVAGNKAVAQTAEPVLVDLAVPELTSIGVGGAPSR
jgi:hypothetical protein